MTQPKQYRDFTATEYATMRCTSYTGGSSWFKSDGGYIVVGARTPVDIQRFFNSNPQDTVRGEFVPFLQGEF